MSQGTFAQGFAAHAHRHQLYGTEPYMVHVGEVVAILKHQAWATPNMIDAAWLHDVLEDTDTTQRDLFAVFAPNIVNWVWAVTGIGQNRRERQASIHYKCAGGFQPTAIKLADRLANVRNAVTYKQTSYIEMYRREHATFVGALRKPNMFELLPLWNQLDTITHSGDKLDLNVEKNTKTL